MFTASEVIIEIRDLARLFPDFNYREQPRTAEWGGCSYVGATIDSTEGKGCIVGQTLQRLGVSKERLTELDGNTAGGLLHRLDVELTESQAQWIRTTQNKQDIGHTWGEAVEFADEMVRKVKAWNL